MSTKHFTTYADRQRAAKLACAGSVLLDPTSTDDDRREAERDLQSSGYGDEVIDIDLLARTSPRIFAAICDVYRAYAEERPNALSQRQRDLAATVTTIGVVAPGVVV